MGEFSAEGCEQRPQPYYDFEIAKICAWLKRHGYRMHVTLAGNVTLVKRPGRLALNDKE